MNIKRGVGAKYYYKVIRNAIEMKQAQQFTIELNGTHGPSH